MKPTKEEIFLDEMEQLNFNGRWQHAVKMGRDARVGGAESKEMAILRKLSQSDVLYERLVAAMGMTQVDCVAEILKLAKDPCDRIAGIVMMPAATLLSDSAILELFGELPRRRFWRLCSSLERRKRLPALVDRYIESGPPLKKNSQSLALLCWASEKVLARQSHTVLQLLGSRELRVIGRLCPTVAATFIEAEVKRDAKSKRVRQRMHDVLHSMLRHHPSEGLKLLAAVLEYSTVDCGCLQRYSFKFPVPVAELALKHNIRDIFGRNFMKKVEPKLLFALLDAGATTYFCPKSFFIDAPLNVRTLFFSSRRSCLKEEDGSIGSSVIESIPTAAEREAEAMRALTEVTELQADLASWVSYISFLPFKKAVEMGDQVLRHKDVNIRGNACYSLVRSGLWHPDCLDAVVDFCLKRVKENDIVRRHIFRAFNDMPAKLWKDHHYVQLLGFLQAALDAKDTSTSTLTEGLEFILRTVPFSHKLSDEFLIKYLQQRIGLTWLDNFRFSKSVVMYLWRVLHPWYISIRDSDFSQLDTGLYDFGSYMSDVGDAAKQFLLDLCKAPGDSGRVGMKYLFMHFKPTALELIPQLLEQDPSWIYVNEVVDALSTTIQGKLLERYLVAAQFKGAFTPSCPKKLLVFKNGYLWTGKKQEMYATSIANCLINMSLERPFQRKLLRAVRVLYSANVSRLLAPLVQQNYNDKCLRDITIDTYGHLEDKESLDVLLAALEDDRAAGAICALHQRLCCLPGSQVLKMLYSALHSKSVSLRKEAIHILRDTGGEDVYKFLMQLCKDEKLHIDVYAALIVALFDFVEMRDVWDLFFEAAKSPKLALATSVICMPSDKLCEDWQFRSFDGLIAQLLKHSDASVVLETLERLSTHPLISHEEQVVSRLFEMLAAPSNPRYFEPTIVAILFSKADASKVALAFAELKLDSAVQCVVDCIRSTRNIPKDRFINIVSAFAKELLQRSRQPSIVSSLICMLPVKVFIKFLNEMLQNDLLHCGATINIIKNLHYDCEDTDFFATTEKELRRHRNPYMQRIGLKMLCEAASRGSWDATRCAALSEYQNSTDRWVSDDAKIVNPQCKK